MQRAAAAIGLAVINPLAALIPLIETGPGISTDCKEVFKSVKSAQLQSEPAEK